MKKLIFAAVVLFVTTVSLFAFNPDELNQVTFVNNTSRDIEYIYLSPADSSYWGPEILGSTRILYSGDSLEFDVHYSTSCADFDILCQDSDGNQFVTDVEICDGDPVTIKISDKMMGPPQVDFSGYVDLKIINETGYDLYYIFVAPGDTQHLGVSYLDAYAICEAGDSIKIKVPISSTDTSYNVFAADEDYDEYSFTLTIDPADGDDLYVAIAASDLDM